MTRRLEGERRPGHFRGVTTVVAKLLHAFQPQRAYFGQKDAQQAVVIRRMVRDLLLPVEIIVCPTVREPDGLALVEPQLATSRRTSARPPGAVPGRCALRRRRLPPARGRAEALRQVLRATLASEPLARPHYVSVADPETLEELQGEVVQALLSLAVQIGKTTLIDNLVVGER